MAHLSQGLELAFLKIPLSFVFVFLLRVYFISLDIQCHWAILYKVWLKASLALYEWGQFCQTESLKDDNLKLLKIWWNFL